MKNNVRINLISSLVYEGTVMISGLIVPRLIIANFGSDVNGLVSSVTQFLAFISLFEGGLGAVVLAALYKPIEEKDYDKISKIVISSNRFFRNVGIFFVFYTIVLSIAYPLIINKEFPLEYTSTLILIISFGTMLQYFFAMTNKLLLQAYQKIYIVNIAMTITTILNLLLFLVIIAIYPNIHFVKLGSAVAYLIQPILFHYSINKMGLVIDKNKSNVNILTDRWSGFLQNLTTYVAMHTDVLVLTVFATLKDVSVYSVYMLALTSIRSIMRSVTYSYHTVLGRYIAIGDINNTTSVYKNYEKLTWDAGSILYSTCLLLIVPFVNLYTKGINDADYYAPLFALIMTASIFIYSVRESCRLLVLAGGKFKQTNFGSVMEVILNLSISIVLVWNYGLVGVAIGTFISVLYRLVYLWRYISIDSSMILKYNHFAACLPSISLFIINIIVYYCFDNTQINSVMRFIVYGFAIIIAETIMMALLEIIFGNKAFVIDVIDRVRRHG